MRLSFRAMLLILISLPMVSCAIFNRQEVSLNKAAVDLAVQEWVAMWNTYNLNQVDSLFLNNSSLTYFSSEKEGAIRGIEAVREHHVDFGFVPRGKTHDNKLWLEDVEVDFLNNIAVVTGIWFFVKTVDGAEEVQRGPVTFVYMPIKGKYRIAHVNFGNYLDEK